MIQIPIKNVELLAQVIAALNDERLTFNVEARATYWNITISH